MSIKIRSPLSEILPLWFAILSPLIGIVLGLVGAWIVGREILPLWLAVLTPLIGFVLGLGSAGIVGR
jgi:hypothetical protein